MSSASKERTQQRLADIKSRAAYRAFGRGYWPEAAGVIQIVKTDADLEMLDLTEMPKDQAGLARAYRKASVHDEHVLAAYQRLSAKLANA